jgi:2-octaprenylphenol hydroxylase
MPDGPVALLPLADGRSSVVWSTTPENADRLVAAGHDQFLEELTAATEGVLGKVTESGPRFAFPLRLQIAESYISDRLALIGDAAHTVHPLAGQGVNLGFLDAAALAEVVIDAAAAERDYGERPVLRRYERWRRGENAAAAYGIDAIGRLFRRPEAVVGALRRAGVALIDGMPVLKNQIVRRAMGLTGDLPRFARPLESRERSAKENDACPDTN